MAICVPIILWAGIKLEVGFSPEYFTIAIAIASKSTFLPLLVFIGGIAAPVAQLLLLH